MGNPKLPRENDGNKYISVSDLKSSLEDDVSA